MQQTTNYNLKLIETSDLFGPEALNHNAETLAAELARVDAALDAKAAQTDLAAEETARTADVARLDAALAAEQSARQSADAAEKSARETAAAAETARVNAALSAEQSARVSEVARLDAAIGTGGTTARIVYGTYTGKGNYGSSNKNSLDFANTLGCAPKLLFVNDTTADFRLTVVNGAPVQLSSDRYAASYSCLCYFTWTETGVKWYNTTAANVQLNQSGRTYYYVAIA